MIVQLTHLRPRPGCDGALITELEKWGAASADGQIRPKFAFVSRDGDHLFHVAFFETENDYRQAVESERGRLDDLMPLLVEKHGPTFFGDVLALDGAIAGDSATPIAAGVYIGDRI